MAMDKTIQFLESRLRDNPKSLLFARLADCYLQKDRVDEAIQLCKDGLKNHPSYVTANFILSKAYLVRKDHEKAETELKKVISYDHQFIAAHKLLGDLMAKMGWENKAALHYREALRIDPMNQEFRQIVERYSFDDELLNETSTEKTVQSKVHPHPYRPERDQETEINLDEPGESDSENRSDNETSSLMSGSETELDAELNDINNTSELSLEDEASALEEIEAESDAQEVEPETSEEPLTNAEDISSQLTEGISDSTDTGSDEVTDSPVLESKLELPEELLTSDENISSQVSEEPSISQEEPLEKTIEDVLNHTSSEEEESESESFAFSDQSFGTFVDHATSYDEDVDGFEAPEAIKDETSDAALEKAVFDALEPFSSLDDSTDDVESTPPIKPPVSDDSESLLEITKDGQGLEESEGITDGSSDLSQSEDTELVEEAIQSGILQPEEPSTSEAEEPVAGHVQKEKMETEKFDENDLTIQMESPIELNEEATDQTEIIDSFKSNASEEPFPLQEEADLLTDKPDSSIKEESLSEPVRQEPFSLESDEMQETAEQAAEEIIESLTGEQDQAEPLLQTENQEPLDGPIEPAPEEEKQALEEKTTDQVSKNKLEQQEEIQKEPAQEPERTEKVVFFDKEPAPEPEPKEETPKPSPEPEPKEEKPKPPETPPEKEKPAESKPKKSNIVSPTLGEIYAAQGQYAKAISVYETLLEKKPDEEKYKDKIAELHMKMKESK